MLLLLLLLFQDEKVQSIVIELVDSTSYKRVLLWVTYGWVPKVVHTSRVV